MLAKKGCVAVLMNNDRLDDRSVNTERAGSNTFRR
jgi:hypothetical protein